MPRARAEGVGGDDRGARGRRPGADRAQGRHRREALRAAPPALLPLPHLRPPAPRAGEARRRASASPTRWRSARSRRGCRCRPTPSCTRPTRSPTPRPSRRSTASTSSRPPTPRSGCKWRRKHPLWAAVLRVWALPEPPVLEDAAAYGGCVSWVELPGDDRRARRAPGRRSTTTPSPRPRARRGGARRGRGRALTRAHVLVCRGPDCSSRGAQDVYTALAWEVERRGLSDEVVQTQCGCVGPLCGSGPVVCCYPTGAWYAPVSARRRRRHRGARPGRGEVVDDLVATRLEGAA